jgi:hypothetical protein
MKYTDNAAPLLSLSLLQDQYTWMPYLSFTCILAVIASFCSGPGKATDLGSLSLSRALALSQY